MPIVHLLGSLRVGGCWVGTQTPYAQGSWLVFCGLLILGRQERPIKTSLLLKKKEKAFPEVPWKFSHLCHWPELCTRDQSHRQPVLLLNQIGTIETKKTFGDKFAIKTQEHMKDKKLFLLLLFLLLLERILDTFNGFCLFRQ